jgi:hypothetical protein
MQLLIVSISVLLFNIPFGYWRAGVKKSSLQWILAIHLAVPFVILLRLYSDIGFALYTYPVLITAYFLGQLSGAKIYNRRLESGLQTVSSCFVMDTYRRIKS